MFAIIYILALAIFQEVNSAKNAIYNHTYERARDKYYIDLYKKLIKLPISFIDTEEGRNIADDIWWIADPAVGLIYQLINIGSMFYAFCVAFITLVAFNSWFSLLFLLLTVSAIVTDVVFDRKADIMRRKKAPSMRKVSYYRWMLTDIEPAKDVRMYNLSEPIKKRYDEEKDLYRGANKALDKDKLRVSLLAEIIKRGGEIVFTVFLVMLALDGKLAIGSLAMYIGFAVTATDSFRVLATQFVIVYFNITREMERFFNFMEIKCPEDTCGTRKLESFESLTFDNVYFKYPTADSYVLKGVSFTFNRGDRLSIVGINGAGKSTIIKLMLGLYRIESGQILIDGYPMDEYNIYNVCVMVHGYYIFCTSKLIYHMYIIWYIFRIN